MRIQYFNIHVSLSLFFLTLCTHFFVQWTSSFLVCKKSFCRQRTIHISYMLFPHFSFSFIKCKASRFAEVHIIDEQIPFDFRQICNSNYSFEPANWNRVDLLNISCYFWNCLWKSANLPSRNGFEWCKI